MTKHAAPAPALFSRPGTYLIIAALTAGGMIGALPAPPLVQGLVAAPVALLLGVLAALPDPSESSPTSRRAAAPTAAQRAARQHIPAAVYVGTAAHLTRALFSGSRPLESEARSGSRPLELRPLGVGRMLVGGWSDAGADLAGSAAAGSLASNASNASNVMVLDR